MACTCHVTSDASVCSCRPFSNLPALAWQLFRLTRLRQGSSHFRYPLRFPDSNSHDALDCNPRFRFHLVVCSDYSSDFSKGFRIATPVVLPANRRSGLGACSRGCLSDSSVDRIQPSVPANLVRQSLFRLWQLRSFDPQFEIHRLFTFERAVESFICSTSLSITYVIGDAS